MKLLLPTKDLVTETQIPKIFLSSFKKNSGVGTWKEGVGRGKVGEREIQCTHAWDSQEIKRKTVMKISKNQIYMKWDELLFGKKTLISIVIIYS